MERELAWEAVCTGTCPSYIGVVEGLRIGGNPGDPQMTGEGEAFLLLHPHVVVHRVAAVVGVTLKNRKKTVNH